MTTKIPRRPPHQKHQWSMGHYTSSGDCAYSTWVCWCGGIKRVKHPSVLRRTKNPYMGPFPEEAV